MSRSRSLGLERPPGIHVDDLELARQILARVYGDLALDVPRDGRRFEWNAALGDLGPVAVFLGSVTTDVILRGDVSGYTVSLASGSRARAASRGSATEITSGRSAAVFSPASRIELTAGGPYSSTTVRIERRFLEAQLEALTGVSLRRPLAFSLAMPTGAGAGAILERLCVFLTGEIEREGSSFDHPVVMASLGDVVAHTLLLGQPHDHSHLLEKPAPPSSRTAVRLVEDYVEAHAAEPIRVIDLTALAGASMASLDAAFWTHRGTTPMALLRQKRLAIARDRLLLPEPGGTVRNVAHAAGFLRPEQFAAAYAGEFGETPAETRRRRPRASEVPAGPPHILGRAMTTIPALEEATVFVMHGDPALQNSMAALLRKAGHTVQVFASPLTFLAAAGSLQHGCAVLDIQLLEVEGLSVAAALRDRGCALPVVFTSAAGDVRVAVEAMKAGAVDFLLEPIGEETLLAAVARALARDAEAQAARAEHEALAARLADLSPREREVCARVARGALNKQIAAELGISESAVRIYRAEAKRKLGVTSAAELTSLFARLGGLVTGGA